MSNSYKMIAFDLDGTLTNSKKEVTNYTKKIIQKVSNKGIQIVLASGRPLIGIQATADRLELSKIGGYIIAYNGGLIFDCKKNEIIFESLIPQKYYAEICNLIKKYQVQALTYNNTSVIAESDSDFYVKKEAYNNNVPIMKIKCLEEYISYPVTKFMAVGEPLKLQQLQIEMIKKYGEILSIFFSEPYFLEIVPKGIEKAEALKYLLNLVNLNQKNLMAFGDGLNDIPMLKYANFSVAMENAYDEVKEYASYITKTNDNDGVAFALEQLILNKHFDYKSVL